MARAKYPDRTLAKLLAADEALTTADFDTLAGITATSSELNTLAGVTASTAEVNYVDTSAPGTVTASKAMIVDANGAIQGWRRKTTADVDGGPLTAATAGGVYTNEGATGAAAFLLPAALAGMEYYFYVMAAFELRIDPDGTETIGLPSSGVQQAAGKYITADAVGEYVHILCVKAGQWATLDYRGTWTVEG